MDFRIAKSYLGSPLRNSLFSLAFLILCLGMADGAEVMIQDSMEIVEDTVAMTVDSLSPDGNKVYEYVANPFLQVLTWPLDKIVAPGVKLVLYPTKAPLRYFLNENVIDRTIKLISFGDREKIMLYPTLNLAPGTGSYTGLTFRHQALFGRPTEKMIAKGNIYVNGDWKFRTYVIASKMFGSELTTKTSLVLTRVKNTTVNQPGTSIFWNFADTSNSYSFSIYRKLFGALGATATASYRDNHFGDAPVQKEVLKSTFFRDSTGKYDPKYRGLNMAWQDRIISAGLFRDTRNNTNIPLVGTDFAASYGRHFTTDHFDYHSWEARWTGYYKLGKDKYEISADEERKSGGMSMRKILAKIEVEKLRREIFSRKVLVFHLYSAQAYELPGNRMPVYGLQTLGNDTPLRGYSGSRFRDYSVAAWSTEYRFPIMRLVDGVLFDEFGIYGRSWDKIDFFSNIKNSWGFGIRVRRPDLYLFRAQIGLHGSHGFQLNLSVDEPF